MARVERGALRLDPTTRSVTWEGRDVELSEREFALLYALAVHPVLTKDELLTAVWGGGGSASRNVVDQVFTSKLGVRTTLKAGEEHVGDAHGQALVVRVADGHDLARPRAARVLAVEEGLGDMRECRGLPADAPARVQVLVAPRRHDPQVLQQRDDARQELLRREAHPVLVGVRDNHDLAVQRLGALQQGFDAVLQAPEALGVGVRRRVYALGRRRDPRRRAERVVVVEDHEPVLFGVGYL